MIALQVTHDEAAFLAEQLRRHAQTVENELVHTDKHSMQHELARDLERLRLVSDRLDVLISQEMASARGGVAAHA